MEIRLWLWALVLSAQTTINVFGQSLRVIPRTWKIPIDRPVGSQIARVSLLGCKSYCMENGTVTIEPISTKIGGFAEITPDYFKLTELRQPAPNQRAFEISLAKPLYNNFKIGDQFSISTKLNSEISFSNHVAGEVEHPVNPDFGIDDLTTKRPTPRPTVKTTPTTSTSSSSSSTASDAGTEDGLSQGEKEKEGGGVLVIVIVPLLVVLPSLALAAYMFRRRLFKGCLCCKPLDKEESNKREVDTALSNQTDMTDLQSSRKTSIAVTNSYESEFINAKEWVSTDPWEIPRHQLKIYGILGEGCFGQVWKAEGMNLFGEKGSLTVAVKTLKESANEKERKDLIQELGVMKMLDPHPNVVKLIGCCTEKDPIFVVMEYVAQGKLQDYLRKSRADKDYKNLHASSECLTSRDLTTFCYQAARGMDYLSSKKVIHRDLAARNILVTEDNVCKVADFGFSRDVMINNIYERKSEGRLPIRWMAPESLYDNIYTTKTDVWSFGVLMWEIVTLGSTPYPGLSGSEVMKRVKEGHRLEKPEHCDREIYNIMFYCWDSDPAERPTFSQLVKDFESMLLKETDYIDLNQFPDHAYYNEVSLSGERV